MHQDLAITVLVRNGQCQFTEGQLATIRNYLGGYADKPVMVRFSKPKQVRSLKQNAYLWAVVYPYIAAETGHTTEECHFWLKEEFLPKKFITIAGKEREQRKSTADLTKTEFNAYIESVVAFAAQELGVRIPQPGE